MSGMTSFNTCIPLFWTMWLQERTLLMGVACFCPEWVSSGRPFRTTNLLNPLPTYTCTNTHTYTKLYLVSVLVEHTRLTQVIASVVIRNIGLQIQWLLLHYWSRTLSRFELRSKSVETTTNLFFVVVVVTSSWIVTESNKRQIGVSPGQQHHMLPESWV